MDGRGMEAGWRCRWLQWVKWVGVMPHPKPLVSSASPRGPGLLTQLEHQHDAQPKSFNAPSSATILLDPEDGETRPFVNRLGLAARIQERSRCQLSPEEREQDACQTGSRATVRAEIKLLGCRQGVPFLCDTGELLGEMTGDMQLPSWRLDTSEAWVGFVQRCGHAHAAINN
ncbi:hypothetical protein BDV96DRAFT_660139 [Lophiotrema nucula]|uniref:Uncharacterized protein n=1 Tax=Lophiotrema nucula TaxID=690887 RepID=A0A6A5Z6N0_9PLEO|nr:hypothetical protein BDV96DRAFT_660139 [Lophiotrema nucula]